MTRFAVFAAKLSQLFVTLGISRNNIQFIVLLRYIALLHINNIIKSKEVERQHKKAF